MNHDDEQSAFIRAIIAAPDDDTPKLIYADWLEERGEAAEAESMRAGVRAGRENEAGLELCWCPPGSFFVGDRSDPAGGPPQFRVMWEGFWMGKFPVTQAEYEAIAGKNPSYFAATGAGADRVSGLDTSRFPVDGVSLLDALAFCGALTDRERKEGRLAPHRYYALPSREQWEYACRAGTTTATPYGDRLDSRQANFHGGHPLNGAEPGPFLGRTTEVGSYPGNPWGFHDFIGNVWEWCADFDPDRLRPGAPPPRGVGVGECRSGGSWGNAGSACQIHHSSANFPDSRTNAQGFRVVLIEHEPK